MSKHFKKMAMGIALVTGVFVWQPAEAKAGDYCREYTRTVYIGNRTQEAYGQACLQPNGDWMIVNEDAGNGYNDNYYMPDNVTNVNYVIRDNNRYVTPTRVVYYKEPRYRYRSQPLFVWNQYGHNWNGHRVVYKKPHYRNDRWDHHDRHGRDDHRGRGRGHRD